MVQVREFVRQSGEKKSHYAFLHWRQTVPADVKSLWKVIVLLSSSSRAANIVQRRDFFFNVRLPLLSSRQIFENCFEI